MRALGAALAALVVAGSCAAVRGPRPVVPVAADDLIAVLAARRAAVSSLRARARVRAGGARLWAREALVVRRPSAVRIDVLTPLGLAIAIGTDGELLWAYPPARQVRYEGAASATNLARFLGAPVTVPDLVDILLGVPPRREAVGPPAVSATEKGEYRLTVPLADGVQTVWFAAGSLAVVGAEEAHEGRIVLRVSFGDHRDGFPWLLEVAAPETATAATLAYDAVEPNAPVDPVVFEPPAAPRVLPLEAASG